MKLDPDKAEEIIDAEGKETPNLPRNRAQRRAMMKQQMTRKQRIAYKNRRKAD